MKDDSSGEKLATLMGKWDESIYYLKGDLPRYQLKLDPSSIPGAVEVWRRHPPAKYPTRYNLTSFAIQLNEMTPGLEVKFQLLFSFFPEAVEKYANHLFDFDNCLV